MSVAGKKLQDIYDAGAAKLSDMDRSQRSSMGKSVDSSLSANETLVTASENQLQQRSKECESDIQTTLSKTIHQIQKVIDSESLETENRLTVLKDNLVSLSKQLQDSISELRQSHEARINVVSEDVATLCEKEFDAAAAELHIQDYSSAKTLKVQNTFVMNTYQQKLDHGLLEARSEEKQITSRVSKSFLQSVNNIDTHTSSWIEKISQSFDSHSQSLEKQFQEGDSSLEKRMDELVAEVDGHAADVQQKVHEYFEHVSFDCKDQGERQTRDLLDELKAVHKTASEELAKLTRELTGELESASETSLGRLRQSASDLKGKVDAALDSVEKECGRRRETSLALKRELEARARELVDNIRKELSDLHASFEQKLKKLVAESVKDLSSLCAEAETSISSAQSDCEKQFKASADKTKDQIQGKLSDLLLKIKKQQDLALEEVMKVATGSSSDGESSGAQNPSPKRGKKKKNSGSDNDQAEGGDK